jgi:hypothetical protein
LVSRKTYVRLLERVVILLASLSLAGSAQQPKWQGSWAASVGSGGTTAFAGTWNAVPGKTPDTVSGSWSLRDQNGTEVATGTWAAAKEDKGWKGTFQARRPSGQIYNGSWGAQVELSTTSQLSALFEAAIAKAVSGNWGTGGNLGGWTIRAFAQ